MLRLAGCHNVLFKYGVEYLVVGGIGAVLHGSPMSTDDVDIVPALKKTNLDSLAAALREMDARVLVVSRRLSPA
jgi:hypothetical protein